MFNFRKYFFHHRLLRFYRLFLANGFAITQIFSDLTDKKALQGFENLCNPFRNPAEEAAKSV